MTEAESKPKSPLELPVGMWVKGGTTSSRYDQQVAERKADAEKRRSIEDERQRLVLQNPQEARLRSLQLADRRRDPQIVLRLEPPPEDICCEMTCELTTQPIAESLRGEMFQLILQLVCPQCVFRLGRSVAESHQQIQQLNRYFWLDRTRAGELYVARTGEPVTLAGTITTEGRIKCSNLGCGFEFVIEKSIIRPISNRRA